MLLYGNIEDMVAYWSAQYDTRAIAKPKNRSLRDDATLSPEVYLETSYLSMLGRELKWTLEDSWLALRDHFCVVDKDTLDLFWPKYTLHEDRHREYDNYNQTYKEMRFFDWLSLHSGSAQKAPEYALEFPVNGDWLAR
jgi:hypothetical protein